MVAFAPQLSAPITSLSQESKARVIFVIAFAAIFTLFLSINNCGIIADSKTVLSPSGGGHDGIFQSQNPSWCDNAARDSCIGLLKRAISNLFYKCTSPPELNCVSTIKHPILLSVVSSTGKVNAKSIVDMNGLTQV